MDALPLDLIHHITLLISSEDLYHLWRSGSPSMQAKLRHGVQQFHFNFSTNRELVPWPKFVYSLCGLRSVFIACNYILSKSLPESLRLLETLAHLPIESLTIDAPPAFILPYIRDKNRLDSVEMLIIDLKALKPYSRPRTPSQETNTDSSTPSQAPTLKDIFPRLRHLRLTRVTSIAFKPEWWSRLPPTLETFVWVCSGTAEWPLNVSEILPHITTLNIGQIKAEILSPNNSKELINFPPTLTILTSGLQPVSFEGLLRRNTSAKDLSSPLRGDLSNMRGHMMLSLRNVPQHTLSALTSFTHLEKLSLSAPAQVVTPANAFELQTQLVKNLPQNLTKLKFGMGFYLVLVPSLPRSLTSLYFGALLISNDQHVFLKGVDSFEYFFASLPRCLKRLKFRNFPSSNRPWEPNQLLSLPNTLEACDIIFERAWPEELLLNKVLPNLQSVIVPAPNGLSLAFPRFVTSLYFGFTGNPTYIDFNSALSSLHYLTHIQCLDPMWFAAAAAKDILSLMKDQSIKEIAALRSIADAQDDVLISKCSSDIGKAALASSLRIQIKCKLRYLPKSLKWLSLVFHEQMPQNLILDFSDVSKSSTPNQSCLTYLELHSSKVEWTPTILSLPSTLEHFGMTGKARANLSALLPVLPPRLGSLVLTVVDLTNEQLSLLPPTLTNLSVQMPTEKSFVAVAKANYDPAFFARLPPSLTSLVLPAPAATFETRSLVKLEQGDAILPPAMSSILISQSLSWQTFWDSVLLIRRNRREYRLMRLLKDP